MGGDYGPYIQSERLALYQEWANWLVGQGKAYRCYCTPERLKQVNEEKKKRKEQLGYDRHCRHLTAEEITANEGKPYVIRFAMPREGQTVAQDRVRGEIVFENKTLNDAVLLKSDGFPTYHLAVVVDDHFMEISHAIRTDEWTLQGGRRSKPVAGVPNGARRNARPSRCAAGGDRTGGR